MRAACWPRMPRDRAPETHVQGVAHRVDRACARGEADDEAGGEERRPERELHGISVGAATGPERPPPVDWPEECREVWSADGRPSSPFRLVSRASHAARRRDFRTESDELPPLRALGRRPPPHRRRARPPGREPPVRAGARSSSRTRTSTCLARPRPLDRALDQRRAARDLLLHRRGRAEARTRDRRAQQPLEGPLARDRRDRRGRRARPHLLRVHRRHRHGRRLAHPDGDRHRLRARGARHVRHAGSRPACGCSCSPSPCSTTSSRSSSSPFFFTADATSRRSASPASRSRCSAPSAA